MLSRPQAFPRALTAVREFHRLASRWREDGVLTLPEARQLANLRGRFEPDPRSDEGGEAPLLIVDRRPVVVAAGGRSARGELVAFGLRAALLRVAVSAQPGERVRVAIPRRPDGRWHRFLATVVGVDRRRRRVTVRFTRPAGAGGRR